MLTHTAPASRTQSCLICSGPLSHLQRAGKDRFCGERCRASYASLPSHEVCVACGRRLIPPQFGERLCASQECRRQVEEERRQRERRRLDVLDKRAEECGIARDKDSESGNRPGTRHGSPCFPGEHHRASGVPAARVPRIPEPFAW